MSRSPESIARRRAQTTAWRAARPGYGRAWAAAHPEVERARRRRWKLANLAQVRESEARRRSRLLAPVEPMPALHVGHPLFDQARAIVGPDTSALTVLRDPLYDDLISVATLAILQGRDAAEDVRRFRSAELDWRRQTCEIFEWWEAAA